MTKVKKTKPTAPKYKYEMIVYWSKRESSFIVEVPELPGCMADGPTYQKAVKNAEDVIDFWIECAIKDGEAIPEPKGRLKFA